MNSWPFAPGLHPGNSTARSERTVDYNCLAFAAGDMARWWEPYVIPPVQPGVFWPEGATPDNGVEHWIEALATVGFERCGDGGLEPAWVKVAILGRAGTAEHATRQLASGRWVSKLGDLEDIEHDEPGDVGGGAYGEVVQFLRRPRRASDP